MAELSSALQNPQALITLAVLGLAVVLFITGVIAPELTGLLSLSLLIATGVPNPQEALAGFGSPALITLLGLFPVSAALFKSGALDRLRALIASASSIMVNSPGLPRLTGPVKSSGMCIRRTKPSIRSST